MKSKKITAIAATAMLGIGMLFSVQEARSQSTPPEPPVQAQSGDQTVGGPAPVGNGLGILLAMGAAYGLYKIRKARRKMQDDEEK